MFDDLISVLQAGGYAEADPLSADASDLGTHEYLIGNAANKRMLTIGSGFAGDPGAFTVFYFTLDSGTLLHHGSNNGPEDE